MTLSYHIMQSESDIYNIRRHDLDITTNWWNMFEIIFYVTIDIDIGAGVSNIMVSNGVFQSQEG